MKSNELIKLKNGQYQLTDGIYNYTLTVGKNQNKTKFYAIYEKDSNRFSTHIFITQKMRKDEDGKKYKCLSAMAGVGGLYIHSDNTYSILSKLKFVESVSEHDYSDQYGRTSWRNLSALTDEELYEVYLICRNNWS